MGIKLGCGSVVVTSRQNVSGWDLRLVVTSSAFINVNLTWKGIYPKMMLEFQIPAAEGLESDAKNLL